ncbi:MAG: anhydro-N-acetylmuramic acid kinase [Rhodospirillales bacterium]
MTDETSYWALGLMSGTSMDGIDAALLRTDGFVVDEVGPALSLAYDEPFRDRLRAALGPQGSGHDDLERDLTDRHAEAVEKLIAEAGFRPDIIGFHGQTVDHAPDPERRPGAGYTVQLGDGDRLAAATGLMVVNDFRSADVAAGGEGAPFAPLYHWARAANLERPLAVLNLGGVGNVTYIGPDDGILAFDTGPANAYLDDWVIRRTGNACDVGGALAALGKVDGGLLLQMMTHPYFDRPAPKSLDRQDLMPILDDSLSIADGAATLTAFTVASVARSRDLLPTVPKLWLVTGGGRHNKTMMTGLVEALGVPVEPVESAGWRGDSLEAEAFGFLAVRHLKGLPTSLPETTAVPEATVGGRLHRPKVH